MEPPPPVPRRTPSPVPVGKPTDSFAAQAALISLLTPVIAFGINLFGQVVVTAQPQQYQFYARVGLAGIGAVLLFAGLILAVIALCGMKVHGRKGIFGKAVSGLILNSFLILLCLALIPVLMKAKVRSEAARKSMNDVQKSFRALNEEARKSPREAQTSEKMEQLEKSLKDASENLTGSEALTMKASGAYLEKFNAMKKDYDLALNDLKVAKVLSAPSDKDQGELDKRRAVVEKFLKANGDMKEFLAHGEQRFRDELELQKVPSRVAEAAVGGYRKKADLVNPLVVRIRQTDEQIGNGMLGVIDLEKTNWGGWKVSQSSGKIVFDETSVLHDYNDFLKKIREASTEQQELQEKLVKVNKEIAADNRP